MARTRRGDQHLSIAHSRTTRQRGHRSPPPEPWDPPCAGAAARAPGKPLQTRGPSDTTAPKGPRRPPGATTAQWVNRRNRTRLHRANPDDLSPAAEHRHHRNHTTTPPATT